MSTSTELESSGDTLTRFLVLRCQVVVECVVRAVGTIVKSITECSRLTGGRLQFFVGMNDGSLLA